VEIKYKDDVFHGFSGSTNIFNASVEAYLDAIVKIK